MPIVAKDHPPAYTEGAGLKKRILHAGHLALHGFQGFANDRRAHTFGAQISYLFDLQQVSEGEVLTTRSQTRSLPASQLPRREMQNS
jgi:hypothetical protein